MLRRFVITVALLFVSFAAFGQSSDTPQADAKKDQSFQVKLQQAHTLYELGRATEALPLYEDLVKQKPDNIPALEGYAMTLLMSDAILTDPEEKKRVRAESRKLFLRARELGDKSNLSALAYDIPEDGSFTPLSDKKDVDAALQSGESEYAKGNYDDAISFYQKALALDPKNYSAALYTGDVLFKQSKYDEAGQWFARTIAIDPNVETAYRYWGDSLKAQGKWDEAKDKFVEAIIAEPYGRRSWVGLLQWADARGLKLVRPNINPPSKVDEKDNGNINITLDSNAFSDDKNDISGGAWLMYPMTHVLWKNEGKFQKQFPDEKNYRHSLAEEMDAFSGVLAVIKEQPEKKKKKMKLDAQLQQLVDLDSKGLLAPYILMHRADEGIAKDYAAYRDAHRDKLREYVLSLIIPK